MFLSASAQEPVPATSAPSEPAEAPLSEENPSIAFTRLVFQDGHSLVANLGQEPFALMAASALQEAGHTVRGADSVLFGQDTSAQATFQLGGTAVALDCREQICEGAVEWQLFHVPSSAVVYVVTTRGTGEDEDLAQAAFQSVQGSLRGLLARPRFAQALAGSPPYERVVDDPDPPRALPPAEEEAPFVGRAPPKRGTGLMVAGTFTAGAGAALILGSSFWFELQRFNDLQVGEFRAMQAVNTLGWAMALGGTGAATVGIVRMNGRGTGVALQGSFR